MAHKVGAHAESKEDENHRQYGRGDNRAADDKRSERSQIPKVKLDGGGFDLKLS